MTSLARENAGASNITPASTPAASRALRTDPAEMLLAARGDDELAGDEEPSPEELQIVDRAREERTHRRRRRRGLIAVTVISLLVIVAALVTAHRSPRGQRATITAEDAASGSSDTSAATGSEAARERPDAADTSAREPSATAQPQTAATSPQSATIAHPKAAGTPSEADAASRTHEAASPEVALPPRSPSGTARATPRTRDIASTQHPGAPKPRTSDSAVLAPRSVQIAQPDPAALPGTAPRSPRVRIDVKQTPGAMAGANAPRTVDYTVRVSHEGGGPVADADVRLRGLTSDGVLVEAPLDPSNEPGVYRGTVPVTPRGPNSLTVRVVRPEGVVEVPVGGTVSK